MKISIDSAMMRYDNIAFKPRVKDLSFGEAVSGKNLDQVIIGSDRSMVGEKLIAAEATQRVVADVRTATASEKVESLRQQIQKGIYRPDADMIAARMLLWKGYVAE